MLRKIFILFWFLLTPIYAENYILFLVDAPHLDYSSPQKFLKTFAKHPSNYSKHRDVGHAWIYLEGTLDGEKVCIEGGHSGELGIYQPSYAEGIWHNIVLGAKNPISYLFCAQEDGFFQKGNGGHKPTYTAKKSLTEEDFRKIVHFIRSYSYSRYSLTGKQCCTFIRELASELGIALQTSRTIHIPSVVQIKGKKFLLWNDEKYSILTFDCPDILEQELIKAVGNQKLTSCPYNRRRKT